MSIFIDSTFDPVPSLSHTTAVEVSEEADARSDGTEALAAFVAVTGALPTVVPGWVTREALDAVGFQGRLGQTFVLPGRRVVVLVGIGESLGSVAGLRDAVAAFASAASRAVRIAVNVSDLLTGSSLDPEGAAQAVVEGAILSRYRFGALKSENETVLLEHLHLVVDAESGARTRQALRTGADRGLVLARATNLARDLGNTPPRHLNATKFATVVEEVGTRCGLEVEVYDRQALVDLGCGGLLGVNAGSVEEPRMIKMRYRPAESGDEAPHLALVGKGIMYDSGGISLKPSDAMHAAMKLDMMGAAAVFASMTALPELDARSCVTGWLMCTDNMPSGSATKLGDVLTIRGGTTVEVKNTDAEGRLVLADGLVLATEETRRPDAIIDIATLTGAALGALGTRTAAMLSNDDRVAASLQAAATRTDESIWRMPLDHRYRDQLKSNVADLSNIGGQYAGAILAALFLNEFVGDTPWGHLDVAGTMSSENDDLWRPAGATGFGTRLLAELATSFGSLENLDHHE